MGLVELTVLWDEGLFQGREETVLATGARRQDFPVYKPQFSLEFTVRLESAYWDNSSTFLHLHNLLGFICQIFLK